MLQDGQVSIIADIVNNLSSGKEVNNYVEYNFLKRETVSSNNKGNIYNKLIVFVCGGGNFVEFEYLDSYLKQKGKTVSYIYIFFNNFIFIYIIYLKVIYGTDHIYSPTEFLNEMEKIYNINKS